MDFYGTEADIAALEARWQAGDAGHAGLAAELAWYLRERDPERATDWCAKAELTLAQADTEADSNSVRARLVLVQAHLQLQDNRASEAGERAENAAQRFDEDDDALGLGDAWMCSAYAAEILGNVAARDAAVQAASEAYRRSADPFRSGVADFEHARFAALKDPEEGLRLLTALVADDHPLDPGLDRYRHRALAVIATGRGDPATALEHFRRAQAAAVASGAMLAAAHAACSSAACCVNLNDHANALEWAAQGMDIARQRGFPRMMALGLLYGAASLHELGRHDEGRTMAREARALLGVPATRSSRNYAIASGVDGMVSLALGNAAHALACFIEGEAIARRLGCADLLADSQVRKARALHGLGRTAQALDALDEALAIGNAQLRAEALHELAAITRDQGLPAPAGSSSPTGAIHCLHAALAEGARMPLHVHSPDWLAELARDYEACGDLASALAFERQSSQARDALHGRRIGDFAATLQMRYESERMANESAHLKALATEQAQRAQAERRRADAEVHANRVKSNFLANMSHELHSPLNAMLGFTRIMLRDAALAHRHEELRIVMRSGEHLYDLINLVMELAKIEAGRAALVESDFDLPALLEDLRGVYGAQAGDKGLLFSIATEEEVPAWIHADAVKLRQVLASLIGNAVKFTAAGFIRVKVMSGPTGALLDFVIEDTGPGMQAADVARTGQVFMQAIGPQETVLGPGLGLAVSRAFVRLMGGELQIHSEPGRGTRASFTVPVKPACAGAAAPASGQRRIKGLAPGGTPPRVLVVDDRAEARLLLVHTLAPIGFELREAADGEQAVAAWRQWSPQLILMDMRMPVMDGREATRRIKAGEPGMGGASTVIIAVTASTFDEQREQILETGCDDFIRKPFSEQALLLLIAKHLRLTYVYDEDAPPAAAAGPDLRSLADLPPELKARLADALERLDVRAVDSAIDAVRAVNPAAADSLQPLALQFDYERLRALLA